MFPAVFTDFRQNSLYGTPPPPPGASSAGKTADEAAAAQVDLIAQPCSEMYMETEQA
jgi:hypothetical protein